MMEEVSWDPNRRRSWASILSGYETVINIVYARQCTLYTPQFYSVFLKPVTLLSEKNNYEISLYVFFCLIKKEIVRQCYQSIDLSFFYGVYAEDFIKNLFSWSVHERSETTPHHLLLSSECNKTHLKRHPPYEGFLWTVFFQSTSNTGWVSYLLQLKSTIV